MNKDGDLDNQHLFLPNDIWSRCILSRLENRYVGFFSTSCIFANDIVIEHINEMFRYSNFDAVRIFREAFDEGIKLNIPLLHRLSNIYQATELFNNLQIEQYPSWCVAALCGDIDWLTKKFGVVQFTRLVTLNFRNPGTGNGSLYFLAIGGHLDIIQKHFVPVLKRLQKCEDTIELRQINFAAGRAGQFHICDYLEKDFQVKADRLFANTASTFHFYAEYGETERLRAALELDPAIADEKMMYYAVRGGKSETCKYLAEEFPDKFNHSLTSQNDTCVHVAAEFGHCTLLKHLITLDSEKAWKENSAGVTPLEISASSGRWDCFWVLLPLYKKHPRRDAILAAVPASAISQNRLHFFEQYVLQFGESCVHAKSAFGAPLSHQLLSATNMTTARILVYRYGMDLTAKDNNGESLVLIMARIAIEYNIQTHWAFIADLLKEFNPHYKNQLHLAIDKDGNTLEYYAEKAGMKSLFVDLVMDTNLEKN